MALQGCQIYLILLKVQKILMAWKINAINKNHTWDILTFIHDLKSGVFFYWKDALIMKFDRISLMKKITKKCDLLTCKCESDLRN